MERKIKIAVFGKKHNVRSTEAIAQLFTLLTESNADIYVDSGYYEFLTNQKILKVQVKDVFNGSLEELRTDRNVKIDAVISMGGDGTFLKAASRVGSEEIPILGVNVGRLGYLADATPADLADAVGRLLKGDYEVQAYSVIEMHTSEEEYVGCPCAVNDVAILKQDSASMITIHAYVNDLPLTTYRADGLIISTPVGSTAYSLSNGGPIIAPDTNVMCLTPVAPHSLNVRPIVISADSLITLEVESRTGKFLAAIDGRSEKLHDTNRITIRQAPYKVNAIRCREHNYYSVLREKMMWGVDNRG